MAAGAAEALAAKFPEGASAEVAEKDLLTIAVDGDSGALFDLQIEQLCGQFTAAIQIVLEYPTIHPDLLKITASQATAADIALVLAGPGPNPAQAFLDARNRVTHQCQRAIDALQITCGHQWTWLLQIASILVSLAIAWAALAKTDLNASFASVIITALLAGFLAPVAKDVLAIVSRLRGQ